MRRYCCPRTYFYPRPPRGGRPGIRPALSALRYFYPRPPRGGRPLYGAARQGVRGISIHALREEGDFIILTSRAVSSGFLSTPSARRATRHGHYTSDKLVNFYPRPPRGGRLDFYYPVFANLGISIHALREEGDKLRSATLSSLSVFLSTPSARRATRI